MDCHWFCLPESFRHSAWILFVPQNNYEVYYKSGEENIDMKEHLENDTKPLKT